MNCKPNDLAVMVRSDYPENVGGLFRVIKTVPCLRPTWEVESLGRARNRLGLQPPGTLGEAADSDLRPIRDPGDDAQDETLSWLPVPTTEGVPA